MSGTVAVAGAVALSAMAASLLSLAFLHLSPTGLSPVHNAVSQYGISDYRAGYRIATISLGLAGAADAVGLATAIHGKGVSAVVALLVIFAVARGVISWLPMDVPGAVSTSTGRTHGLIAVVTFAAATTAALKLGGALGKDSPWQRFAPVSTGFGGAMLAILAVMFVSRSSPSARKYFGAVERVFYLAMMGFLTVVAALCALRV